MSMERIRRYGIVIAAVLGASGPAGVLGSEVRLPQYTTWVSYNVGSGGNAAHGELNHGPEKGQSASSLAYFSNSSGFDWVKMDARASGTALSAQVVAYPRSNGPLVPDGPGIFFGRSSLTIPVEVVAAGVATIKFNMRIDNLGYPKTAEGDGHSTSFFRGYVKNVPAEAQAQFSGDSNIIEDSRKSDGSYEVRRAVDQSNNKEGGSRYLSFDFDQDDVGEIFDVELDLYTKLVSYDVPKLLASTDSPTASSFAEGSVDFINYNGKQVLKPVPLPPAIWLFASVVGLWGRWAGWRRA